MVLGIENRSTSSSKRHSIPFFFVQFLLFVPETNSMSISPHSGIDIGLEINIGPGYFFSKINTFTTLIEIGISVAYGKN